MVELVKRKKKKKKEKNGIFLHKGHLSFTKDKMLPDELSNIVHQSAKTGFLFFPFVGKIFRRKQSRQRKMYKILQPQVEALLLLLVKFALLSSAEIF